MKLILPDNTIYLEDVTYPPPQDNIPIPVPEPSGWLVEEGDGQIPAVVLHDEFFEDRTINLAQTNETQPHRPFENGSVSKAGKIIVKLHEKRVWWDWFFDLLGATNAERFAQPGDGFMDTNAKPTDIYDPNAELKFMCCPTAGDLLNIIGEHRQSGSWYDVVQTLDFNSPPVKGNDGIWRVGGEALSYETHPHLFFTRVNRVRTTIITWLTRNKINSATDGGITGGKGDEHWPAVSNRVAVQPRYKLQRYPTLPHTFTIYKNSLIVNGNLVEQLGGITVVADAYKFSGSNTFIRDKTSGLWYKADEMLIRADIEQREPGNGFDWRFYIDPWMSYRGYRSPICGWQRE